MKHRKPISLSVFAVCALLGASAAQEGSTFEGLKSFRGTARLYHLVAREKNLEATAYYPIFRGQTPLLRFVNAHFRRDTRANFSAWIKQSRGELREFPNPPARFEYQVTPTLVRLRPARIISICVDSYSYSGGAHGMGFSRPVNFGMVGDRPKVLTLGDFFRVGAPYRTWVETKIFAKLRKNPDAAWVQDKSVKNLSTAQFNNFEVGPSGLKWIFNAYEMGPYAAGQFEVKLSAAELGPDFRREWLK